jgi:hypothetical protein
VSDRNLVLLLLAVAATLAAGLLWFRDRFRDLRHVSEAERRRSEQRNATGALALGDLIWAAAPVHGAFGPGDPAPRIAFGLVAIVLLAFFWRHFRQYRKIGSKE